MSRVAALSSDINGVSKSCPLCTTAILGVPPVYIAAIMPAITAGLWSSLTYRLDDIVGEKNWVVITNTIVTDNAAATQANKNESAAGRESFNQPRTSMLKSSSGRLSGRATDKIVSAVLAE